MVNCRRKTTRTVRRAIDKRILTLENRTLRVELEAQSAPGPRIIDNTPAMQQLRATIAQIANTGAGAGTSVAGTSGESG